MLIGVLPSTRAFGAHTHTHRVKTNRNPRVTPQHSFVARALEFCLQFQTGHGPPYHCGPAWRGGGRGGGWLVLSMSAPHGPGLGTLALGIKDRNGPVLRPVLQGNVVADLHVVKVRPARHRGMQRGPPRPWALPCAREAQQRPEAEGQSAGEKRLEQERGRRVSEADSPPDHCRNPGPGQWAQHGGGPMPGAARTGRPVGIAVCRRRAEGGCTDEQRRGGSAAGARRVGGASHCAE